MKIVAITQARHGSTRLPAKVLKKVGDKTLLEIHLERILQSKKITKLVVATTEEAGAEHIIEIARKMSIGVYQGSVDDVLERFYYAAVPESPDYVVRLTSDCPLIDPVEIDKVIEACIKNDNDYVSNTLSPTFPDGVDVEVFTFKALEKAFHEATLKSDSEHVTPYIKKNSTFNGGKLFKSSNLVNPVDCSSYRITVDTEDDFWVIESLIKSLGTDKTWKDYIDFLDQNRDIKGLNEKNIRDEGYLKSLLND